MSTILRHDRADAALAGAIVALHREVYGRERAWNHEFGEYVAEGLAALVPSDASALWTTERDGALSGCIAVVGHPDGTAQLRWFLVHPDARGSGIGTRLLDTAIRFARETHASELFLWTVAGLDAASRLYQRAGFRPVETVERLRWGARVTEERHVLPLAYLPGSTSPEVS